MITLELPWPPSINDYYGHNKKGQVYIKKPGKRFRKTVGTLVAIKFHPRIEGRIRFELLAFPPDNRERDLDNLLKATQDALQIARVYEKDSQIDRLEVERASVDAEGRGYILVTLEEWNLEEAR